MTDSFVFALPTLRLRWCLLLHLGCFFFFWSLWRRYTRSFSATITAVHHSCCIPVLVLNANLFVRAESRSAGTSSRLSSRFSGIISQGETETVNNRRPGQLPDAPAYYSTVINLNHVYLPPDQNNSSNKQRGNTVPPLCNVQRSKSLEALSVCSLNERTPPSANATVAPIY